MPRITSATRRLASVLLAGSCYVFASASFAEQQAEETFDFTLGYDAAEVAHAPFAIAETGQLEDDSIDEDFSLSLVNPNAWEYKLGGYLWLSSVRANTTLGPLEVSADANFIDLVQHMDMAGMMRFEARKGRWGFYTEGMYLRLSDDANVKVDRLRIPIRADGELIQLNVGLGAFYRFGDNGRFFDLMAGGRYTYLRIDASVTRFIDPRVSKNYFDPIIGGRFIFELSERWLLTLKGDIGGFGAGTNLTWGGTGLFGYRLTERTTLAFGYRYYSMDADSGKFKFDVQYYGPMIAIAYRF